MSNVACAGKVAVITGASRGIGAGLARVFSEHGMKLALCARGEAALPASADVHTAAVDVSDADAVQRFAAQAVDRFGHIDLWVNNAGLLEPIAPLATADPKAVTTLLRVNIEGVFNGARVFLRHLHERRLQEPSARGVLVNLSSGAARNAYAGWSAYCASKAAVDRMTECLQLEEGERGLNAFSLAPGVVDTDMQAAIRATPEENFPQLQKFIDLKRREAYNSPEHVAGHVLALAFDPATHPHAVCISVPDERG